MTGGGSGGHITPLLSLAGALKLASPQCHLVYVGLKGDRFKGLQDRFKVFDEVRLISTGKFRRYHGESWLAHIADLKTLALNARDFFKTLVGIYSARKLMKKIQPDVVFSKGGFVGVPVGIAAHWRGTPIITHDSDATPGLSNRILGRWAAIHTTGMPAEFYNYPKETTRYVGIPIDERIQFVTPALQAGFKSEIGVPGDALVLLVTGGGLGSRSVNQLVLNSASQLLEAEPRLFIVHLSGHQHQAEVSDGYDTKLSSEHRRKVKVIGFSDELYKYSGAADVIITRAGATVLAEFAAQAKACIVIPSTFLSGGHQLQNAKLLADAGAAKILADEVSVEELTAVTRELLRNQPLRQELAKKLNSSAKMNAAGQLAQVILDKAGVPAR